jgi:hypothetical protein
VSGVTGSQGPQGSIGTTGFQGPIGSGPCWFGKVKQDSRALRDTRGFQGSGVQGPQGPQGPAGSGGGSGSLPAYQIGFGEWIVYYK